MSRPSLFSAAPEILAPAGNREMMHAAVENGADAIYFGIQEFNARLRADNFSIAELPETMRWLHQRGVKGYITLNVLIFQQELEEAASVLRACSASGVDAVLIQDLGLALLAKLLVPELPVHASTQMTLTSAESVKAVDALGLNLERVVTARELSKRELALLCKHTDKEIEVFVHGALCVAYSGQCLTSEALGGRSANRGECAQACRLPYDLIVDGVQKDLDDLKYLLSPKDLAAYDDIAELMKIGIVSLKIEGRLKTPEYVAAAVQAYRSVVDQALANGSATLEPKRLSALEATFSRGFTGGYLHEINHQTVVEGDFSSKRGSLIGEVVEVRRNSVCIRCDAPLKLGDGVLVEGTSLRGTGLANGASDKRADQGGSVYQIFHNSRPLEEFDPEKFAPLKPPVLELAFADGKIDFRALSAGARVWKTSDPRIESELRASFAGDKIRYRRPISARITAKTGSPLTLSLTDWDGLSVSVSDSEALQRATKHPITESQLREQLERLGDTPFRLVDLDCEIVGEPMVPLSRLNSLRRSAAQALAEQRAVIGSNRATNPNAFAELRSQYPIPSAVPVRSDSFELSALCRTLEQVEAAAALGVTRLYTDFEDIRQHREAKSLVAASNCLLAPATIRIIKPGEAATVRRILQVEPEAVLVRNLASWHVLATTAPEVTLIGDYSLNVANEFSARLLLNNQFSLLTPSYDLNFDQLTQLINGDLATHFEITAHQYMPMFHMEHCVFCRFLSTGTDSSNCGRPCEEHSVTLRDRKGYEHLVKADFACRNTVFNGVAQSAAEYLAGLRQLGAHRFRLDFLAESAATVERTIGLYRSVLTGTTSASELWQTLKVESKLGVTRGSLDQSYIPGGDKLYKLTSRKPAHGSRRVSE